LEIRDRKSILEREKPGGIHDHKLLLACIVLSVVCIFVMEIFMMIKREKMKKKNKIEEEKRMRLIKSRA
jgi:hypothetical protein